MDVMYMSKHAVAAHYMYMYVILFAFLAHRFYFWKIEQFVYASFLLLLYYYLLLCKILLFLKLCCDYQSLIF